MLNKQMHYTNVVPFDLVNGDGCMLSLFVSGCIHACKGCFNSSVWNPKSGIPFDGMTERAFLETLGDDRHTGLSLLGGDPLHPRNVASLEQLCRKAKELYPQKDIWLWTGYLLKDVEHLDLLEYVDIIIDGKYEMDKPTFKPFRGSDNQIMYRKFGESWLMVD